MKGILRGLVVVASTVGMGGVGMAHAHASAGTGNLHNQLQAAGDAMSTPACVTTHGRAQAHLLDGTLVPGKFIDFDSTGCPRGAGANGQLLAARRAAAASRLQALRRAGSIGPRCAIYQAHGAAPTSYYATARVNANCVTGKPAFIENLTGSAGNGWDRAYDYDGELGNYTYYDIPFSCGSACDNILTAGASPVVRYTGAQLWWSVNDGSYVRSVTC